MALVFCADCGREVSDAAKACVGCGRPMNRRSGRRPRVGALGAAALSLSLAVFAIALAMTPAPPPPIGLSVADARAAFERAGFAFHPGEPAEDGSQRIVSPLDVYPVVSVIGTGQVKRIGVIGLPDTDTVAAIAIAVKLVFADNAVPATDWFNGKMAELRRDNSRNVQVAYSKGRHRAELHWLASTRTLALSLDP